MKAFCCLVVALLLLVNSQHTRADDWPQWLGPDRASEWREAGVVTALLDGDLPAEWRAECSYGYSGPAVADGKVYLFDYRVTSGEISNSPGRPVRLTGSERLHCLDAATGDALWTNEMEVEYYVSYPAGPRATPTVDGDHVFTLGAEGDLVCRRTADGEPVWHVNFLEEFGIKTPIWGHSSSPLVVGDLVYVMVGGEGTAIVAFNKQTGEEAWRALSSKEPGYSSPVAVDLRGEKRLMAFHPAGIAALDLQTGSQVWAKRMDSNYGMSIAPPRVQGEQMFVGGYGASMLLDGINSGEPSIEWRGTATNSISVSNPVPYFADGVIFGCDAEISSLVAVDPANGDRLWENQEVVVGPDAGRRVRHGTAFLVRHTPSGRFFLFNERGELHVAEMNRDGFTSHGKTKLLEPTNEAFGREVVWSHPAFAEQCVFARNDNQIVCVRLAE